MKIVATFLTCLFLLSSVSIAEEFSVDFEWGDIPLCTTGSPNTVANPKFILSGVPEGTKVLSFQMTDLDAPDYNHGGGTVEYTGQGIIEPGAFKYESPCPPNGTHTYVWNVTAKNKKSLFAKKLGKAKARKQYPQ